MPLQFTVLASGSAGNASFIQADGFGLLLDAGLGPRKLAARLAAVGASWSQVRAVLLTHTHADHWKDKTLIQLQRRRIPLYCHESHHEALLAYGAGFASLHADNLVRSYDAGDEFHLAPGLRCRPLPLRHDGGVTFGFRLESSSDLFDPPVALGYVADLGSWDLELARGLADVDLLALEFNHDVDLEYSSGRSPYLIARVLSEEGHLSNTQAMALLHEVMRLSKPGRLCQVVQLHLSRDCNRPDLAAEAARQALLGAAPPIQLYTASQDVPGPTLLLGGRSNGHREPITRHVESRARFEKRSCPGGISPGVGG
jgi:phosphoribosyl 1,2-cyclic phosphodiesterase